MAPADRVYTALVAFEHLDAFPFMLFHTLPYPDRRVVGRRSEEASVGGERECPDRGRVPGERLEAVPVLLRVVDVELYGVVVGGGGEDLR